METYDIYFRDEQDSANKGFNLKDKEKAIRMCPVLLIINRIIVQA